MKITQKAEELFDLPSGSLTGEAHLEIEGCRTLCAQGDTAIISYDDDHVRFSTRSGEVRVSGDRLVLECFRANSICVKGRLLSVEFL